MKREGFRRLSRVVGSILAVIVGLRLVAVWLEGDVGPVAIALVASVLLVLLAFTAGWGLIRVVQWVLEGFGKVKE